MVILIVTYLSKQLGYFDDNHDLVLCQIDGLIDDPEKVSMINELTKVVISKDAQSEYQELLIRLALAQKL